MVIMIVLSYSCRIFRPWKKATLWSEEIDDREALKLEFREW